MGSPVEEATQVARPSGGRDRTVSAAPGTAASSVAKRPRHFRLDALEMLVREPEVARSPHPNRVPEAVETAVLEHALAHPCHGPIRVAHELALKGV